MYHYVLFEIFFYAFYFRVELIFNIQFITGCNNVSLSSNTHFPELYIIGFKAYFLKILIFNALNKNGSLHEIVNNGFEFDARIQYKRVPCKLFEMFVLKIIATTIYFMLLYGRISGMFCFISTFSNLIRYLEWNSIDLLFMQYLVFAWS